MKALQETLSIALAAAPWLLLGLTMAGLVKALISEKMLGKALGGDGVKRVALAAVMGAPLPLCSCGAIPTALALYRGGAGRGPATAFLIGTPGVGVDSVAVTYALLGPFMAVARVMGTIATAIATGLLVAVTGKSPARAAAGSTGCQGSGCCGDAHSHLHETDQVRQPLGRRLSGGLAFAFNDVLDDITVWLVIGLVAAGVLIAYAPPETMMTYGSGLPAMLMAALIGIPLYLCATAATPIAAGMIASGISPGTALVFLLAGPITSLATLGVLRREFGGTALVLYLTGIVVTSVMAGLLVDAWVRWMELDLIAQVATVRELLPPWLEWSSLILLLILMLRPLGRRLEMNSSVNQ
ncbi:SO_0444 family Cu/Zn efflux transporter [Ectothiorhodospira lacustris]|uniref:SO_0444 family Cu/Zn efflux transporter n=1 Tax=Ectothiorhodospira lacustris TaxID=2899127 RepID=UPI001EE971F8|nr:SO_0444 family Cu/Zn efflux transporter [Ectothiorhodospira lacustris]MCG5511446.1 SO_0444 family Cu/Zn efflux transporter [Ectothiorhodospira lacustris]MCG5523232.1 SO_0444 family Cu/Zn efflux transporter [Ectothiorhodospira lacustris]